MNTRNEYILHICYQFHESYFKKTFNKLYCCKWMAIKGCLNGDDQISNSSASGSTESVETTGQLGELIEFVNPIPVCYNYDDDITIRFELFCTDKSISPSTGSDSRRNSDTFIRFRSSGEVLFWDSIDSFECELNAVIHRGRLSEEEDGRIRDGSPGRFTVISERLLINHIFSKKQIHMEIAISQLEKRGKMKYTDLEVYLAIYRKNLKNDSIIVYRSPKKLEITSTSLHKFPEIVISYEKLLCGIEDRIIYFILRNAANGNIIGETDVFYSNLVSDGKVNLKLRSHDININSLFGVSKFSLRSIGVLHINFYMDNNVMNCFSRNGTVDRRRRSSMEHSSSLISAGDRCQHLVQDEFKFSRSTNNVILASGRTQAYLVSLLAPTIEVQLRHQSIRPVEPLIDNNFYKYTSSNP
ncbi:putative endoglucanase [Dirofilaria immitis]